MSKSNLHFFITGHTGFKGSWLTLLLKELGHSVSGFALAPPKSGLFERGRLREMLDGHTIGDIRNFEHLEKSIGKCNPDYALHFAAQPIVIESYENPLETYKTNVDGTLNFLRALQSAPNLKSALVITTDKVYRDENKISYIESDPLGGHDPYSASKAMADLLTQSWSAIHPEKKIHVARAGNVIGAFDVSPFRLVPDITKAILSNRKLRVRNPESVRPWQHVLDCLSGYLLLLKHSQFDLTLPTAFNFGPPKSSLRTVEELLKKVIQSYPVVRYEIQQLDSKYKETKVLSLDSSLAERLLGWKNQLDFNQSVEMSLDEIGASSPLELAKLQIRYFLSLSENQYLI